MKLFFFNLSFLLLITSCSSGQAKHVLYDMLHEKQRQDCLNRARLDSARLDCQRAESYEEYKSKREEEIK